jgi:hypothetical protein
MIKFATLVDGKFMVYTKYSTYNYTKKPVLSDTAVKIYSEEFNAVREEAMKHKETYYEEVIR